MQHSPLYLNHSLSFSIDSPSLSFSLSLPVSSYSFFMLSLSIFILSICSLSLFILSLHSLSLSLPRALSLYLSLSLSLSVHTSVSSSRHGEWEEAGREENRFWLNMVKNRKLRSVSEVIKNKIQFFPDPGSLNIWWWGNQDGIGRQERANDSERESRGQRERSDLYLKTQVWARQA